MNTDIRIDWQSGMEITPQTFIDMENNISEYRMLVRKMIAAKNFGIIPRTKFSISQEVFNDVLLLKQIDCDVLLPTGQVVVIETNANISLNIPPKDVTELYLTVELGDRVNSFNRGGTPLAANEVKFDIKPLEEIRTAIPLLKLVQNNGNWSVYDGYIMPVMTVRSSVKLLEKLDLLKQSAQKIMEHNNINIMEGRVMVEVLIDQLTSFSVDDSSRELVLLCKRIATALSFAIYKYKAELPAPNIMNVEPYLDAFIQFLEDSAVGMNGCLSFNRLKMNGLCLSETH